MTAASSRSFSRPSVWILFLTLPALAGLPACRRSGDIQAGSGAAGIGIGQDRAEVEKVLGPPERVTSTGIQGAEKKQVTYCLYPTRGIDVLLENGKVRSLFLYHEGADDHRQYQGRTPEGLTLSSSRDDVLAALGEPNARGLEADADRWFRYDSGIEFSFRSDGSLHHVVVTGAR